MTIETTDKLLHAILSMDSYNRGYDASVLVVNNYIGEATFIADSSSAGFQPVIDIYGTPYSAEEYYSFYAAAYSYGSGNQKIISYRGTDNRSKDTLYGWGLVSGSNAFLSVDHTRIKPQINKKR